MGNAERLNAPISRAKKIDSDEYVEGQYCEYKGYPTIFDEYGMNGEKVNPSTLEISFDNGEKFYFIEAVKWLIQLAENTPSSKLHELLEAKVTGIQE